MYSYTANNTEFYCGEDVGIELMGTPNYLGLSVLGGFSTVSGNINLWKFYGNAYVPGSYALFSFTTIPNKLYKLTYILKVGNPQFFKLNNLITSGIEIMPYSSVSILDVGLSGKFVERYFISNSISTDIVFNVNTSSTLPGNSSIAELAYISLVELNPQLTDNRIRCFQFELTQCGGSPGGGGLEGDCDLTVINNGLILCTPNDSWNCNLCPNDLPYWNPVVIGDPFMFQFQQFDLVNGVSPNFNWSTAQGWGISPVVEIYDCCTDTLISDDETLFSIQDFVGIYNNVGYNGVPNWKNIQQASFDLNAIYQLGIAAIPNWDKCFYLKFTFYSSTGATINVFTTEPYKFVDCDETVILEGVFSKKDCFEYWRYKDDNPPSTIFKSDKPYFQYRNTYRIYGSFELVGFEINKEFVGVKQYTANIEREEIWLLRTNRLPERVVRLISGILASEYVYVNNRDYISVGTIDKNNDIGSQWFLESQLKRVTCSKTSSCD